MKKQILRFWQEEEGLGTLELVIIVAVLVGVALLFGQQIVDWVNDVISGVGNGEGNGIQPPTTPSE